MVLMQVLFLGVQENLILLMFVVFLIYMTKRKLIAIICIIFYQ